jgi:hypothetical protein
MNMVPPYSGRSHAVKCYVGKNGKKTTEDGSGQPVTVVEEHTFDVHDSFYLNVV